jgi:hypothetical protein
VIMVATIETLIQLFPVVIVIPAAAVVYFVALFLIRGLKLSEFNLNPQA